MISVSYKLYLLTKNFQFFSGLCSLVFICTICSIYFTAKFGAKKLYIYGGLIIIPGLIVLMVTTMKFFRSTLSPYFNIFGTMIVIIGFTGPKQSLSIYPSELTTCTTRPLILWISSVVYYFIAIAVTLLTPLLIALVEGFAYLPWIITFSLAVS